MDKVIDVNIDYSEYAIEYAYKLIDKLKNIFNI